MAGKISEFKGETDRQRIIRWLKDDVKTYRSMVGEVTEFNTVVTEEMISRVQQRINELEEQEVKSL
jgi:hypothetical protein